jgi:hypothetical protein
MQVAQFLCSIFHVLKRWNSSVFADDNLLSRNIYFRYGALVKSLLAGVYLVFQTHNTPEIIWNNMALNGNKNI